MSEGILSYEVLNPCHSMKRKAMCVNYSVLGWLNLEDAVPLLGELDVKEVYVLTKRRGK